MRYRWDYKFPQLLQRDYIKYFFLPLLLRIHKGCLLLQIAYLVRFNTFLAVLILPTYYSWITVLSSRVCNTFAFYLLKKWLFGVICFCHKNHNDRRGCTLIPYHLLSGVGIFAYLLSSAKTTYSTWNIILLFLSPLNANSLVRHLSEERLGCHRTTNLLSKTLLGWQPFLV